MKRVALTGGIATGKSVVQWIVSGRMAEARRLLLQTDEMIDVIAERVGYADPTHFIRMFRREHGATPAAWRAEQNLTLPLKLKLRLSANATASAPATTAATATTAPLTAPRRSRARR